MPAPTTRSTLGGHPGAALELDGVREALLHHPHGRRQRLVRAGLVGAEREVGHDEGAPRAAGDRSDEGEELVDRHGHGRLVAEHVVRRAVADEQDRDAGLFEHGRGVLVVGGEHGEALAALLHLPQVVDPGAARWRRGPGGGRVTLCRDRRRTGSAPRRWPVRHGSSSLAGLARLRALGAGAGLAGPVLAPPAGDRQPAVPAERDGRRLGAGRRLAALPLGPVDHRDDGVDDGGLEAVGEELRAPVRLLHVLLEQGVEQVVGRQRVLVDLPRS